MVEILQKREIQLLAHIVVLLHLGEICGQIDGELFVSDGVFQNVFVHRL